MFCQSCIPHHGWEKGKEKERKSTHFSSCTARSNFPPGSYHQAPWNSTEITKEKNMFRSGFFSDFSWVFKLSNFMSLLWICRRLFFSLSIDELPFASFNFDNFFVRFSLFFLSLFLTFHESYFSFKVKLMYIALFGIFGFWLLKQRWAVICEPLFFNLTCWSRCFYT